MSHLTVKPTEEGNAATLMIDILRGREEKLATEVRSDERHGSSSIQWVESVVHNVGSKQSWTRMSN